MVTSAGAVGFTIMVIVLELVGLLIAQTALDLTLHEICWLFEGTCLNMGLLGHPVLAPLILQK